MPETFKNIFFYKLTGLNFILVPILAVLSVYSHFAVPVLFILITNLFDILGYHFTLIRKSKTMPDKEIIKAYRINQLMFDAVLLILLGLLTNWVASLCGALLKITGTQDLMYYLFLQMSLPEKWTWLKWTPLGLFKKTLIKREVLIQAVIGIIISYTILIVILNS